MPLRQGHQLLPLRRLFIKIIKDKQVENKVDNKVDKEMHNKVDKEEYKTNNSSAFSNYS